MFVVRKPFRNYGIMMLPGSIVEPGNIKWFKSRVKDRIIVEVNEHNFNDWKEYFIAKYGVTLVMPTKEEPVKDVPKVQAQVVARVKAE